VDEVGVRGHVMIDEPNAKGEEMAMHNHH